MLLHLISYDTLLLIHIQMSSFPVSCLGQLSLKLLRFFIALSKLALTGVKQICRLDELGPQRVVLSTVFNQLILKFSFMVELAPELAPECLHVIFLDGHGSLICPFNQFNLLLGVVQLLLELGIQQELSLKVTFVRAH